MTSSRVAGREGKALDSIEERKQQREQIFRVHSVTAERHWDQGILRDTVIAPVL